MILTIVSVLDIISPNSGLNSTMSIAHKAFLHQLNILTTADMSRPFAAVVPVEDKHFGSKASTSKLMCIFLFSNLSVNDVNISLIPFTLISFTLQMCDT